MIVEKSSKLSYEKEEKIRLEQKIQFNFIGE